ncbi:hypothetical protein NEFER03_1932 [Nematocida sp. LUAm3]|nr:hypothetical protein NEFER03_1932 [Nematocida sp. LUAm3]KAI5176166.1 hypothetical protein NEFER02_1980 [Nematocida sp. LUAm2]KAI5179260.1 hypothetical protein NEFER01_2112 [Nematocida sp. LUAm1]
MEEINGKREEYKVITWISIYLSHKKGIHKKSTNTPTPSDMPTSSGMPMPNSMPMSSGMPNCMFMPNDMLMDSKKITLKEHQKILEKRIREEMNIPRDAPEYSYFLFLFCTALKQKQIGVLHTLHRNMGRSLQVLQGRLWALERVEEKNEFKEERDKLVERYKESTSRILNVLSYCETAFSLYLSHPKYTSIHILVNNFSSSSLWAIKNLKSPWMDTCSSSLKDLSTWNKFLFLIKRWREEEERVCTSTEERYMCLCSELLENTFFIDISKIDEKVFSLKKISCSIHESLLLLSKVLCEFKRSSFLKRHLGDISFLNEEQEHFSVFKNLNEASGRYEKITENLKIEKPFKKYFLRRIEMYSVFSSFFPPDLSIYAAFLLFKYSFLEDTENILITNYFFNNISLLERIEKTFKEYFLPEVEEFQKRVFSSKRASSLAGALVKRFSSLTITYTLSLSPSFLIKSLFEQIRRISLYPEEKHEASYLLQRSQALLEISSFFSGKRISSSYIQSYCVNCARGRYKLF